MNFMVFSKHLAGPPLPQVASQLRSFGVDAVDLTVRKGGHVAPDAVDDELPAMQQSLRGVGCRIGMITTEITDPDAPLTRRILEAAARLGIRYYKLGYWGYQGFGTLRRQRDEVAARIKALAAMNQSLGLVGGFHNHSDTFFGASLWDIEYVLRDTPREAMGLYWDPAHATIEGGSRGWEMGLDLLADRLVMLSVKDFRWVNGKHRYAGARQHSVEICPLAEGNTEWPKIIALLQKMKFDGPISFHSEYQGAPSFRELSVAEVVDQTGRDIALFNDWWRRAAEKARA